jgi:hypothetical protein
LIKRLPLAATSTSVAGAINAKDVSAGGRIITTVEVRLFRAPSQAGPPTRVRLERKS